LADLKAGMEIHGGMVALLLRDKKNIILLLLNELRLVGLMMVKIEMLIKTVVAHVKDIKVALVVIIDQVHRKPDVLQILSNQMKDVFNALGQSREAGNSRPERKRF
jgi:hypothetical protein